MKGLKKAALAGALAAAAIGTQSFAPQRSIVGVAASGEAVQLQEPSTGKTAILLNGQTRDVWVQWGTGVTIDDIKAGISAKDMFGADVPYEVSGTVDFAHDGDYPLTLTATDAYGQTATATVVVHVVGEQHPFLDNMPPYLSQEGDIAVGYSKGLSYEEVKAHVKATDDIGVASLEFYANGKRLLPNEPLALTADDAKRGSVKVHAVATDFGLNSASLDIEAKVLDDVAPEINATLNGKEQPADGARLSIPAKGFAPDSVKALFSAVDAVDGKEEVIVGGLPEAEADGTYQAGSYALTISAQDKAGNKATATATLELTSEGEDLPSDAVAGKTIAVSAKAGTLLTPDQIAGEAAKALGEADASKVSVFGYEAYRAGYDKAGTYRLFYVWDGGNPAKVQGQLDVVVSEDGAYPNRLTDGQKALIIGFSCALGVGILLLIAWFVVKAIKRRKKKGAK